MKTKSKKENSNQKEKFVAVRKNSDGTLKEFKTSSGQVYDYEQRIMVTLRVDKAQSLLKAMEMITDKAIAEDREASFGIILGGSSGTTNMLVMSTMKREGSLDVVVHVCREVNPQTKLPAQRFSYTFIKDEEVVEGYNLQTGEVEDIRTIHSEYEVFKEALRGMKYGKSLTECMQNMQNYQELQKELQKKYYIVQDILRILKSV